MTKPTGKVKIAKVWKGEGRNIPPGNAKTIDLKTNEKIFFCADCLKEGSIYAGLFINGKKAEVLGIDILQEMLSSQDHDRVWFYNFPTKILTKAGKYEMVIKTAPNDGSLSPKEEDKIPWKENSFVGEINYLG